MNTKLTGGIYFQEVVTLGNSSRDTWEGKVLLRLVEAITGSECIG